MFIGPDQNLSHGQPRDARPVPKAQAAGEQAGKRIAAGQTAIAIAQRLVDVFPYSPCVPGMGPLFSVGQAPVSSSCH
jgi:hypothetical protein